MRKTATIEAGGEGSPARRAPLTRLAIRIDRRLEPVADRVDSRARAWGTRLDGAALRVAAAATRPVHPRRRAAVTRAAAAGRPVAHRSVSVITLPPPSGSRVPSVVDGALDVVVAETSTSRVEALAQAAARATGDVLCFLPDPIDAPAPGWLPRLAARVDGDVVATTPSLVHPARLLRSSTPHDLLLRSAGYEISVDDAGAPELRTRGSGQEVPSGGSPADVLAAPLRALTVDRSAFIAAGGLVDAGDDDSSAVDLTIRLRQHGGRVQHVPDALVYDDRPVGSLHALHHPLDPHAAPWRSLVDRRGPALRRAAEATAPATTWAITTAVPSPKVAARWGDWHFAEALARSLRRLDHQVLVQRHDEADSPAGRSCDVHLVLHGLGAVRRTSGQRHILWVISHPELVDDDDCDRADLVLVASERFAAHLRTRTSTPVEVLLQATDHHRFQPRPCQPTHRHDLTVVAKTRDVLRPIVADAIAAGLRPAIYGGGWRSLVDPRLVVADHVDNVDLPSVYSSAGVVLNDHWDAMRTWGFVSNRLFDVLACATPVISDHLDELADLFGDAVPTYRTPDELRDLVAWALDHPAEARARANQGRATVLARHTFDHRAQALMALVDRHLGRDLTRMEPQP